MAGATTNMYDLLNNEEQHSKKPQQHEGPGKPDKSDQRRSIPRGGGRGGNAGAASFTGGNQASGEQHQRTRVDDRDRRGGRGGGVGGAGRGGRGGRGGYHGDQSDGVHRNFDRRGGQQQRHAPGEARKQGAVGEVDPSAFHGSSAEYTAQDAAVVAEANGDIVMDEILDVTPMPTDPDDAKLTYDEYLAQKQAPEDDRNRQTREVTNDGDFKAVRQLKKDDENIFGEVTSPKDGEDRERSAKADKKKKKISLDEFVGAGAAASSSSDSGRGGRGGSRGGMSERGGRGGHSEGGFSSEGGRGGRGGARGGFDGPRGGGRGGFDGQRGGGRGGFDGQRGGGRGGRGGFDGQRGGGRGGFDGPRGGRGGARAPAANVNLADQSAFPALSPK